MPASANRLLSCLSPVARDLMMTMCTDALLPTRTGLYQPETTPAYAYFVTSGLASVVVATGDGSTVEVELIGNEGVVGALHLLGPATLSTDSYMQIAGGALQIRLHDFRKVFNEVPELHQRVLEYVQQQTLCISQIAGCNRLHDSEQRLARWLLMAQDRTQSDVMMITQEFLATMLGATRTTVTGIAGSLQRKELIEYKRGRLTISNRPGLEAVACICYPIVRSLSARLYAEPWSNGHVQ